MAHDPAAIETIDDTILKLARQDVIWDQVAPFFNAPQDNEVKSVNLIEFVGMDAVEFQSKVDGLKTFLDEKSGIKGEAVSYLVTEDEKAINSLWLLRKKGVKSPRQPTGK